MRPQTSKLGMPFDPDRPLHRWFRIVRRLGAVLRVTAFEEGIGLW